MMWVEFQGNRIKSRTVEKFALSVLNHYFKRQFKRDIEVTIKFVKELDDCTSGYCSEMDVDHYLVEVARGGTWPGEGYVEYNWQHQMETLAHELVHVKQYIRKQYGDWEWDLPHSKRPSEIEAFKFQRPLYEQYYGV